MPSYPSSPPFRTYYVPSPARSIQYISQPVTDTAQSNSFLTTACDKPQSLSISSNSPYAIKQGNTWLININQIYGMAVPVNSVSINTQGEFIGGIILLTLINSNQQQIGTYRPQTNINTLVIFQNLPSIPIGSFQLQFPTDTQSNRYLVDIVVCPQSNAVPLTNTLLDNQVQNVPSYLSNNNQVPFNEITPQRQFQQVSPTAYFAADNPQSQSLVQEIPDEEQIKTSSQLDSQASPSTFMKQGDQQIDSSSVLEGEPDDDTLINQEQLPFSSALEQTDKDTPESQQTPSLGRMLQQGKSFGEQQLSSSLFNDEQSNQDQVFQSDMPEQARQLNQVYQKAVPWMSGSGQPDQIGQDNQQTSSFSSQPWQSQQMSSQPYQWGSSQSFDQNNQQVSSSPYRPKPPMQWDQTGSSNNPYGSYNGPNDRDPSPMSDFNNQKPNNNGPYGQKPGLNQNTNRPPKPYPPNQPNKGLHTPPLTMRYSNEEVPCTLYLVRPGSRRIVSNLTDDQSVTWTVQVPRKYGYASIPNIVSAHNTDFDQLVVNYVNVDQSPTLLPNGTALEFISTPDANDINTFPDDIPAQMLEVVVDGISPVASPSSLEIHMIICYKPLTALQSQQSQQPNNQYQQTPSQSQRPPSKSFSSNQSPYSQSNLQSQQSWQPTSRTPQSQYQQYPQSNTKPMTQPSMTASIPTRNPSGTQGYCNCNCQCPSNAVKPIIQGANVVYQYSSPTSSSSQQQQQQQQRGRRRRR
ncbi:hypothetical protein I4U23_019598 [Adineta vaga]|nr:hypothetical protein I4U23_019598 [Adineta vaga]